MCYDERAMLRKALLNIYDTPDPLRPGFTTPGYDRDHARRTAAIVVAVAPRLGVAPEWLERLETAALLHDLGRAGMDPSLFGAIFRAAAEAGLPVRLGELRERCPETDGSRAVDRFLEMAGAALARANIAVTDAVRDHVAMRMDYRGRLTRMIERHAATLARLRVVVEPWMEKVVLYYYYPHLMEGEPAQVRRMGMLLVACENFEAANNAKRGRDYYGRSEETMAGAFDPLRSFEDRGILDRETVRALACTAASGALDTVVQEARGNPTRTPLPADERALLHTLCTDLANPVGTDRGHGEPPVAIEHVG